MGNGVKVLLVAMLVVSVVVVAKVVNNDTESDPAQADPTKTTSGDAKSSQKKTSLAAKTPKKMPSKLPTKAATRQRTQSLTMKPTSSSRSGPRGPAASPSLNSGNPSPQRTRQSPSPSAPIRGATGQNSLIGTSHTGTRSPNFRTNIDRQSSDGRGTRVAGEAKPPEQASTNSFSPVASLKNSLGDETDTKEKRSAPVTISNVVADGKPISADKSMKPLGEKTLTLADRSIRSASVKSRSQGKDKASAREYPKKHEVQRGDSYWALAEKYYKAGKYHALISKANSGKKLRPGMKVSIPAPPEPKKQKTSSPPSFVSSNPGIHVTTTTTVPSVGEQGRVESTRPPREELPESSDGRYVYYVVRKGDTLDGLARRFLKKGEAEKIRQANRSLIYTSLRAGQRIRIPKS